jgi:hypothetical protein
MKAHLKTHEPNRGGGKNIEEEEENENEEILLNVTD